MKRDLVPSALSLALVACACSAQFAGFDSSSGPRAGVEFDLQVARAPYDSVDVNWKHRLDQPYVFAEARGSYTLVGKALESVFQAAREQGLTPVGAPFVLYYDDPGVTPVEELRLRACLPVKAGTAPRDPLRYDILPSTTVVYAYVAGPYPDAPRAYPALYAFMRRMSWVENGPIREVYLLNPAEVSDWNELVCEIQLPAGLAR